MRDKKSAPEGTPKNTINYNTAAGGSGQVPDELTFWHDVIDYHLNHEHSDDKDIVEGILPRGLTVLYAQPKAGKSLLALSMAHDLCEGESDVLGYARYADENSYVIYFALDDSPRTIRTRMAQFRCDHNLMIVASRDYQNLQDYVSYYDLGNPINMLVQDIISRTGRVPALVIVDTLEKSGLVTEHDYQSECRQIGALKAMAEDTGYCLLLVHHATKANRTGHTFGDAYGSNGLIGEADILMKLENTDSSSVQCLHIRGNNYTGTPEIYLRRDENLHYVRIPDNEVLIEPDVPEKDVTRILKFMVRGAHNSKNNGYFCIQGTYPELIEQMDLESSPSGLGHLLSAHKQSLAQSGIQYSTPRSHGRRKLKLQMYLYEDPQDTDDTPVPPKDDVAPPPESPDEPPAWPAGE